MPSNELSEGRKEDRLRRDAKPAESARDAPSHGRAAPEDKHIGALEDQVTPTMPPRPDDDEPKQG
jgi:hypothetical protein